MQYVIEAVVGPGSLERPHVQRLLYDTDSRSVPARVHAYAARVGLGDVEALAAQTDPVLYRADSFCQAASLVGGHADEVVGEPLGRLGADARQLV